MKKAIIAALLAIASIGAHADTDANIDSKVAETMYDMSRPVAYVGDRDNFRAITLTACPIKNVPDASGFAVFYAGGKFTPACWFGDKPGTITTTQIESAGSTWLVNPSGLSITEPDKDFKPAKIPRFMPPAK